VAPALGLGYALLDAAEKMAGLKLPAIARGRSVSFKPRSIPTASLGATDPLISKDTGKHNHQSPTESCAKQPDFQVLSLSKPVSNTRIDLPENRSELPRRFSWTALKGTQP
jgi:hypothetical protein